MNKFAVLIVLLATLSITSCQANVRILPCSFSHKNGTHRPTSTPQIIRLIPTTKRFWRMPKTITRVLRLELLPWSDTLLARRAPSLLASTHLRAPLPSKPMWSMVP